jgi:ParB/RepB/Spo0J family partition protein
MEPENVNIRFAKVVMMPYQRRRSQKKSIALVKGDSMETLKMTEIVLTKDNYRRQYDPEAMAELTASVKDKGVLQPILVRPYSKKNGNYQVVFGSRRFKAAQEVGLEEIPVMIRELSDIDAYELQVIENSQREDPNPIEEAQGFKRLLDLGKHTPDTLAEKIGRSVKYVLSRLKLLGLCKEAHKALESGEISLGHGMVLTRLRHESEQKDLLKEIREEDLSVVNANQEIRRNYSHKLAEALFDTADCQKCEFLSGNQVKLFEELAKTDECGDGGCYFAKTRDHFAAILKLRKAQGFKVIKPGKKAGREKIEGERIHSPEAQDKYAYHTKPKRYKGQCLKCKEFHVWFLFEVKDWRGAPEIEFGEVCTKPKCLKDMNKAGKGEPGDSDNGSSPTGPDHNARRHAKECRDRFLCARLPIMASKDPNISKRLLLLYMAIEGQYGTFVEEELGELLKGLGIKIASKYYAGSTDIYRALLKVPAEDLDRLIESALFAKIAKYTDTDVLLLAAPEAGVKIKKELAIDEDFLKLKTKAQLFKLAHEDLKLKADVQSYDKKASMIEEILGEVKAGDLPADFKEVL